VTATDKPPSFRPSRHCGGARGWARSLDQYGFARYSAIIVSPDEGMGWMHPVFSAWTVRREGVPSLPVCEPARLVG
jgi:hypothetical protein